MREVKETSGTARQVEERSEAREKKTMGTEGRKDDAGQTARERDVSRRDGGNISTSARRTTRGQRNIGWQRTTPGPKRCSVKVKSCIFTPL